MKKTHIDEVGLGIRPLEFAAIVSKRRIYIHVPYFMISLAAIKSHQWIESPLRRYADLAGNFSAARTRLSGILGRRFFIFRFFANSMRKMGDFRINFNRPLGLCNLNVAPVFFVRMRPQIIKYGFTCVDEVNTQNVCIPIVNILSAECIRWWQVS